MNIETLLYAVHDTHLRDDIPHVGELCVNENKYLTVLIFGESLPIPPLTAGSVDAANTWAQRMLELDDRLNSRASDAAETLRASGVNAEVRTVVGDGLLIDDVIGMHARYSDMVLMQRHASHNEEAFSRRLCHGVLFQSGRPVLVYSEAPPAKLTFESIVVAWDGKLAASRAISSAMPFLKAAGSVHVLCIDSEGGHTGDEKDPGWDLSAYLARHQLDITLHHCDSAGQSISSVIQTQAEELGAELIVMGAYGRSRLRERLFGGTTSEMIKHSAMPVLMSH